MAKIIYPDSFLPQEGSPSDGGKGTFSFEAIVSEIQQKERMLLEAIGELCEVYIRKTSGATCGCFHAAQKRSSDPNCPICYGVGIIGGYDVLDPKIVLDQMKALGFDPDGKETTLTPNYIYNNQLTMREINANKFLFRFPQANIQTVQDRQRTLEIVEINSWTCLTFITLKNRDIIVRQNGDRYRVKSARLSNPARGISLHQKVILQYVNTSDPIYFVGETPINYQTNPIYENLATSASVVENGGMFLLEDYFGFFS